MAWFTAHIITYFKLKSGSQDSYTVWENMILIEADNDEEAMSKAQEFGKQETENNSLTVDGQPAETIFAGVRKISEVFHVGKSGKLKSGDEVAFNWLVLPDKTAIDKLVKGEEVIVNYVE